MRDKIEAIEKAARVMMPGEPCDDCVCEACNEDRALLEAIHDALSACDEIERDANLYRQGNWRYRCQCGRHVWDGDKCKCATEGTSHSESPNSATTDRKDDA